MVATGTALFEDSTLSASVTVGLFSAGREFMDLLVDRRHRGEHLRIVQDRVVVLVGFELMAEIDDSPAPVHQAIQTSALTCLGVALSAAVNRACTRCSSRPVFPPPVHLTSRSTPWPTKSSLPYGLSGPAAPPDRRRTRRCRIPCSTRRSPRDARCGTPRSGQLSPRPRTGRGSETPAGWDPPCGSPRIPNDLRRQYGRPVALPSRDLLRVVRLVAVHPADDDRIVLMGQVPGILDTDDRACRPSSTRPARHRRVLPGRRRH